MSEPAATQPPALISVSRGALKLIGRVLAVAGVAFIGLSVFREWDTLAEHTSLLPVSALALASGVYLLALLLLSLAWTRLLNLYAQTRVPLLDGHISYARSQIAKYLPGNVFQYAGRYALARQLGADEPAVLRATAEELLGVSSVFAAGAVVFALLFIDANRLPEVVSDRAVLGCTLVLAGLWLARWLATSRMAGRFRLARWSGSLILSWCCFAMFLGLSLVSLWVLAAEAPQLTGAQHLGVLAASFCLSWLAGFVVPGAPGGIGVRESAFVLMLDPYGLAVPALALIIQFRVVTVVGDLAFFATSFLQSEGPAR